MLCVCVCVCARLCVCVNICVYFRNGLLVFIFIIYFRLYTCSAMIA